jgi:hypothetical protein
MWSQTEMEIHWVEEIQIEANSINNVTDFIALITPHLRNIDGYLNLDFFYYHKS